MFNNIKDMILKHNSSAFGSVMVPANNLVLLCYLAEIMNKDSVQFLQILLKIVIVFTYKQFIYFFLGSSEDFLCSYR